MRQTFFHKPLWLVLAALLSAAGGWLYVDRVLIPYQVSDAAMHGRPRGNLSDLYLHWVGARELLLHGRDPYSPDVTREIQQGYYGRQMDPERPSDPRDQRFAYPVYVTFYLAPLMYLPFGTVRIIFFVVLLVLTVASVFLWLRVLRWPVPMWESISLLLFTMGALPVVQGLKLQQMTLVVAGLVAIAFVLLRSNRFVQAGIVLALATAKPQLVWLLLVWLLMWTLGDGRRRYRLLVSFLLTMTVLWGASEWLLPHWAPRFLQAMLDYPTYTDAVSTFDKLLPASWAWMPRVLAVGATLYLGWKNRRLAENTWAFTAMAALTLSVTIIVIPSYALYNEIMLLPALLLLLRDLRPLWHRSSTNRVLAGMIAILLFWPWLASIVLATLSFVVPPSTLERAWAVPLWTVVSLPVVVAALVLVTIYQQTFTAQTKPGPS